MGISLSKRQSTKLREMGKTFAIFTGGKTREGNERVTSNWGWNLKIMRRMVMSAAKKMGEIRLKLCKES